MLYGTMFQAILWTQAQLTQRIIKTLNSGLSFVIENIVVLHSLEHFISHIVLAYHL